MTDIENRIENDFYTAELKDGEWFYKSKIPSLKGDKRYKDAPRYPMIYEYEGEIKKNYNKMAVDMVKQIGIQLMKYTK